MHNPVINDAKPQYENVFAPLNRRVKNHVTLEKRRLLAYLSFKVVCMVSRLVYRALHRTARARAGVRAFIFNFTDLIGVYLQAPSRSFLLFPGKDYEPQSRSY